MKKKITIDFEDDITFVNHKILFLTQFKVELMLRAVKCISVMNRIFNMNEM